MKLKKFFPKLPFILILAYAFLPSLSLLGVTFSFGDLFLLLWLSFKFFTSFQAPIIRIKNPLFIHSFVFLSISFLSFLLSSILIGDVNYINSLIILLRPFAFIVVLETYFDGQNMLDKNDYLKFIIIASALIILFSFIVVINVGNQFTSDDIWNYNPTTRLVGLRGVIIGGDGKFSGNDSVNFSLFVCLISLIHFSFASLSNSLLNKGFYFILGITLFALSSLSLSKSSYVFIAVFVAVLAINKLLTTLSELRISKNLLYFSIPVLTLIIASISSDLFSSFLFPRIDNLSIEALIENSSSQARLNLVSGYIQSIYLNPFMLLTGYGTGSLIYFFNTPHFEGLFVTVLAENGFILLFYLLFILKLIFFPVARLSTKDNMEAKFLLNAFLPFVFVSFFSSLTIHSSLLYPILYTMSYSLYHKNIAAKNSHKYN